MSKGYDSDNEKKSISWEAIGIFLTILAMIAQQYPDFAPACIVIAIFVFGAALLRSPIEALIGGGLAGLLVILQSIIPGFIDNAIVLAGTIMASFVRSIMPARFGCGQALVGHVLFGFGLFFTDRSLGRKWIWPIFPIYAIIDLMLATQNIDPFTGDFGGYTFFFSLAVYLLSFIDILLVCRSR